MKSNNNNNNGGKGTCDNYQIVTKLNQRYCRLFTNMALLYIAKIRHSENGSSSFCINFVVVNLLETILESNPRLDY